MIKLMTPDQHPEINEIVLATNNINEAPGFFKTGKISKGFLGLAYFDGTIWREAEENRPITIGHWIKIT